MQNSGAALGQAPSRQTASEDIQHFADRLAGRAQDLAKRVEDKLNSVMTGAQPNAGKEIGQIQKGTQALPPLFASLSSKLTSIEGALDSIESALSRTEL